MSTADPRLAAPGAGPHPALVSRRIHDLLVRGITALVALGLALGIAVEMPNPEPVLVLASIVGALLVIVLLISPRYEVTVTLLVLYLGLLDGPAKLLSASQAASAGRNVLILAIAFGMAARASVSRERVRMPPLSGWVIAFVAVAVVQALNPGTNGFLKIIGGYRQQLEWVPFFFFGYMLMRDKERFRKLFLILGVIALANGAVGAYQTRLSTTALGAWGPGYGQRISGTSGSGGRGYRVEGQSRPRPPALGSDAGFGGGIGVLALPGLLALLAVGRLRHRWLVVLLGMGALAAIGSSASRSSIIMTVVALVCYAGLSVIAGLKITRLFIAVLAAVALAVGVGVALVAISGKGVLARQETVTNLGSLESHGGAQKERNFLQLPRDIAGAPFGAGLGTGAAAGGFGGKQQIEIEGKTVSREGSLNLLVVETGLPGMLLWVGLVVNVIALVLTRLRWIRDVELRTYLVAVFSVFGAFVADGFGGPDVVASPPGVFMWFAAGVASYWLAGPGLRRASARLR